MKKVLSILLSVAMIVLCFAACGKTDGDKSSTGKAANVKVGFIFLHDENSTYDKNFITAAEEACKKPVLKFLKRPTSAKHRLAMMQQQSLLTKDAMSSSRTASAMSLM